MPVIRANRDSVDDRFSVLGFSIRTESPLFEVGVATDPELFRPDGRNRRNRRNFFSSRAGGALRARRGEAVYLLPADVMAGFVGQPRLYFGLATYDESSGGVPNFVQTPTDGHMYVNIAGLTERGLRRMAARPVAGNAGGTAAASLVWGGDARPAGDAAPGTPQAAPRPATPTGAPVGPVPYDDGFGPLTPSSAAASGRPAPGLAAAPTPAAKSLGRSAFGLAEDAGGDDDRGIDGPIPDAAGTDGTPVAAGLVLSAPEYPQARRYVPAAPQNYRATAGTRTIERIVIHITDGGTSINGTIAWFQNPRAGVSAHYVIGQDGEVVQMVAHNDVAWHARSANSTSIGIEHVANTRGLRPTPQQYCASAALVAWLCDRYGIPHDRTHILGHAEADPRTTHTGCPNAVWDWGYYLGLVTSRTCYAPPPPAQAQGLALGRPAVVRAQEIITPFYNPRDPASALTCQNDAFSQAREEWFAGVPNTRIFPHSAICYLERNDGGAGTGFYIGRNRILTACHVVHGATSLTIIPGKNDASEPFGRCSVTNWRPSNRYPAEGSNYDLAVIDNVPIAAPDGRWFEFLNQTPGPGMAMVVCGYSAQSDAVPELTDAINGDMQHLHAGYVKSSAFETFDYPILTLHGASGSPIYHIRQVDGVLQALVAGVHVSGAPAAQGLNRGCFITPAKIDWIEGLTTALGLSGTGGTRPGLGRSLANESFALYWNDVSHVHQTSPMSCWAAAAAMVAGWDRRQSIPDTEVDAKAAIFEAYAKGLYPRDRPQLALAWDLVPEPPACYPVDEFRRLLDTYGPLWIDTLASAAGGGHVRVLIGMESDGNPDGSDTTVLVLDPGTATPNPVRLSFQNFLALYEGRLGNSGDNYQMQILHAADTGGRRPAAMAQALTGQALGTQTVDLDYQVPLIPQPDKRLCWAAAMAMVVAYRRSQERQQSLTLSPESLVNEIGSSLLQSYPGAYNWTLMRGLRDRYRFQEVTVPSNASLYFDPSQWEQWLGQFGPLWVVIVGAPHAVVVAGLRGDTSDPASVSVKILNPWDVRVTFDADPVIFNPANQGYESWQPFNRFASDFGTMAEPDYGNWRILHLPSTAAASQSLAAGRSVWAAPPAPVRAFAAEELGLQQPGRIPGTTLQVRRGQSGRVTWSLEQLQGLKYPDPAPAVVAPTQDQSLSLADWPCLEPDSVPLPLTLTWGYTGAAVGEVRIEPGNPAQIDYACEVNATVEDDDPAPVPGPALAALKVRISYRFIGTSQGNRTAVRDFRIYANGRHDGDSRWD
ncbi:papain-like cysteine protease family protein [uncultured Thiodictyon sp.]|uniref:papain-like cysteine protease family protein n=1 Tax=uncultured Thiodictyon sp. TaxID=1846217 RepID=UPI0025D456E2|nr:papain-like cysteine protease family protein [uncultured Thiodictyon sp.]